MGRGTSGMQSGPGKKGGPLGLRGKDYFVKEASRSESMCDAGMPARPLRKLKKVKYLRISRILSV